MKYLTNSEMSVWRECKRRWYLGTYRRLIPRGVDFNKPTGIGTRVHDTLAIYYQTPPSPSVAEVMEYFEAKVKADIEAWPAHESDITKEADLCRIMLEGYFQWLEEEGADQGLTVIASESARIVELYPDRDDVKLLSKIDARVMRDIDQARLALEFKTVANLTDPLPMLQLDTQLLTEHLTEFLALKAEGKEAERADGVMYTMLRKVKRTAAAKPPFYGREPVLHNIHELRNHWRHVVAVHRQIEEAERWLDQGVDHHDVCPPSPNRDCKWKCQFFKVCAMLDDGTDYEPALQGLYEVGNPLERYGDLIVAAEARAS